MKKRIFTAFTLITISASFLLAQPPNGGTPPTAAQMVANKVARLTALLTLTTAQQTEATTIYTAEQSTASTLMTSLQTARTALQTAVLKNDQNGITTDATQIGTLTTQLTEAQAKADAAFYLILTADQQTKFTQLHLNGGGGGFGGPRGFGGGRARG